MQAQAIQRSVISFGGTFCDGGGTSGGDGGDSGGGDSGGSRVGGGGDDGGDGGEGGGDDGGGGAHNSLPTQNEGTGEHVKSFAFWPGTLSSSREQLCS